MSIHERIRTVIKEHNLLHLATVDLDGNPSVRGITYVHGDRENILYFVTHEGSRKMEHIHHNDRVAIAIDHECPSWEDMELIKFIKGTGRAVVVEDGVERTEVLTRMAEKFSSLKDLPEDATTTVVVKIVLQKILFTDNSVSMGYTEKIRFDEPTASLA